MKLAVLVASMAAVLFMATGPAFAADRLELGMPLAAVAALYPRATQLSELMSKSNVLELTDVEFAGTHWTKVDMIFTSHNRLDGVQLTTKSESYDSLKTQISERFDDFIPFAGATQLVSDSDSQIEVKICDRGSMGVSLTLESPRQPI